MTEAERELDSIVDSFDVHHGRLDTYHWKKELREAIQSWHERNSKPESKMTWCEHILWQNALSMGVKYGWRCVGSISHCFPDDAWKLCPICGTPRPSCPSCGGEK